MKLTKISLAALVALGAFSSVASATPLEEAIKNVDISGMARYRYTTQNNDNKKAPATQRGSSTVAGHQFKLITNFKAAIDDNFFGVIGFRYNTTDGSGHRAAETDNTNVNSNGNFGIYQFYLGYTRDNTTLTAGKQVIGSFFTDDEVGTGLKIVNQSIEGLTLAAYAFDALEHNSNENDGNLLSRFRSTTRSIADTATGAITTTTIPGYNAGNLYMVSAVGSYDPIGFQLWYASLENLTDLLAVEVTANVNVTDDFALGFKGQFVNSDADSDAKNHAALNGDYNDGKFYAGELSTSFFGADIAAGYIGWKVDDRGTTSFSFEDQGGLIDVAEQFSDEVGDYTFIQGKGSFWFAKLGYGIDKFKFGVDYIKGNVKFESYKLDYQEVIPSVAYQYNKKLKFSTFYSWAKYDDNILDTRNEKSQKYRFEAKYSF